MKTLRRTLESELPTLAVFMRIGGQNASEIKHQVDDIRSKFAGKVNLIMVDTSFDEATASEFKISKYPTWVIFSGKTEKWRAEGHQTLDAISKAVRSALK